MDIRSLSIEKREGKGKELAKRLRRAGRVPAVLYGGSAPLNISVNPKDIFRLIHGHEGGTQLVQVAFDGTADKRMAIIRDMQFDPVSEDLVHVDLQEVAMDRAIQVTVPLRHVGEPVGVRETKGILEMILREVQVSCLPSAIPESLTADVSDLAIGDVFTVRQLPVPEGVRVLTDPNQAVATVAPPMAEEVVAAPATGVAAATPAEPEVLTERKPKEEGAEDKADAKDAKKK
jgi:large subunit ribosomal protein L25